MMTPLDPAVDYELIYRRTPQANPGLRGWRITGPFPTLTDGDRSLVAIYRPGGLGWTALPEATADVEADPAAWVWSLADGYPAWHALVTENT